MTPSALGRYAGRRVLVTGHTGFKGSWLTIWLHQLGADVVGLALEPESDRDNFVVAGVEELCRHVVLDIRDRSAVSELLTDVQPDVVFHLAAQSLVLPGYEDPWTTFTTNVVGTVSLLDGIRTWGGSPSTVVVTTDKVYEDRDWPWGYREVDRLGGHDPYSASKACTEAVAASYRDSYLGGRLSLTTARAGNVVGAGDWAKQRIVPDVYRYLRDGVPLRLRHPSAVRPWQHVLEPLYGYLLLAAEGLEQRGDLLGPWNFGPSTSQERTVAELVEALLTRSGGGSFTTEASGSTPHETAHLTLDSSKARQHLGWRPILDFESTVDFVADGYSAEGQGASEVRAHRVAQIDRFMGLVGRG